MRPRRSRLVVATSLLLAACSSGDEPTLGEPTDVLDDAAAQEVYALLGTASQAAFTATYEITPSVSGITSVAVVRHEPGEPTEVEIGDVVFVGTGESGSTCAPSGCRDGVEDAVISSLNVTHRFWAPAFATRLRLDTRRRIGFTEGSTTVIAGRDATCVAVPQPGPADVEANVAYCAIDAGPLARYAGADVAIELTAFEPGPPELTRPQLETDTSE